MQQNQARFSGLFDDNDSLMTDRYAVVGNPIDHSKSPIIHAEFAKQTGQDMSYKAILVPLDNFAKDVNAFFARGGRGMNVTLPFKLQAFELAAEKSPRALDAGAVNTLKFSAFLFAVSACCSSALGARPVASFIPFCLEIPRA